MENVRPTISKKTGRPSACKKSRRNSPSNALWSLPSKDMSDGEYAASERDSRRRLPFFSHRGRRIDAPNDWLEFDNARKYLKTPSRIEGRGEFASIRNLTARRSYVPRKGNEGENVGPPISHARLQDEIPKYSRVGVATRRRSKIRK